MPVERSALPALARLICLLSALAAAALWTAFAHGPQRWAFDSYQRLSQPRRAIPTVLIVDIDAVSVRTLGRWPWPRDRIAHLIASLQAASVVGVDILLLEPEGAKDDNGDRQLAGALKRVKSVLAAADEEQEPSSCTKGGLAVPVFESGDDPRPFIPRLATVAWPLPLFTEKASAAGPAVAFQEPDGVLRRLPSLYACGVALLPSFAVEVARTAIGAGAIRVRTRPGGVEGVDIGALAVGTDSAGAVLPHFARESPSRIFHADQVLDGRVDPGVFAGRIVLIGSSLAGLGDTRVTPLGEAQTGTEINAQVIESILSGDWLRRPDWAAAAELLSLSVLGSLSLYMFGRFRGAFSAGLLAAEIAALSAAGFAAFRAGGVLLDWTVPAAGLVVAHIVALVLRVRGERRARMSTEQSLSDALANIEAARNVVARAFASSNLATLGELSAVLAHELVQPLAVMSMAAENAVAMLEDDAPDLADARLRLERIAAQAIRARALVDRLRVFSRADPGESGPVDLSTAVENALVLVAPSMKQHGVRVTVDLARDLPPIRGQSVLLEQVVANLCINARDALATTVAGAKELRLSTSAGAGQVWLEVRDNGSGIPEAIMPRLFEPFFTTKPSGEGTGLGLAICRKIVVALGGQILAATDDGAVFTITLPMAAQSAKPVN